MKTLAIALIVGLTSGLIGALCGVGGGIVMVPAFTLALGLEHKRAIATSLAVIVITAITSSINNHQAGLIDWRIVALTSVGAAAAAWWGTDLMHSLHSTTLTRIFAITLIIFGVRMLIKP